MKAVIFDMDGVITDTAILHAEAWHLVFTEVLKVHRPVQCTFSEHDYVSYIDGRSRLEGIRNYLRHKNIELELGVETDCGINTQLGIGNLKNKYFNELIDLKGINVFEDSIEVINMLIERDTLIGIGTSSKNAHKILQMTGLHSYFSFILDGVKAAQDQIASKPDGAFYRYCCEIAGKQPNECIVIEDSLSGVKAAKKATVGTIIGLSRSVAKSQLFSAGADIVVDKLTDVSSEVFIG